MSWRLELRRAGCLYAGTSPGPGTYEYPYCTKKTLKQINVSSPQYGKEWNRWGWFVARNIPEDWKKPPNGETWEVTNLFKHYMTDELNLHADRPCYYAVIAVFHPVNVPISYPPVVWYKPITPPESDYVLIRALRLDQASTCNHYIYIDGKLVEKQEDKPEYTYVYEYLLNTKTLSKTVTLKYANTAVAVEGNRGQWLVEVIRDGYLIGLYLVDKYHPMTITVSPEPMPKVKEVQLWISYRRKMGEYQVCGLTTRVVLDRYAPQDLSFEYSLQYYIGYWKESYRGRVRIYKNDYYGQDTHEIWYSGAGSLDFRSCVEGVCSNTCPVPAGCPKPEVPPPPEEVPPPPVVEYNINAVTISPSKYEALVDEQIDLYVKIDYTPGTEPSRNCIVDLYVNDVKVDSRTITLSGDKTEASLTIPITFKEPGTYDVYADAYLG